MGENRRKRHQNGVFGTGFWCVPLCSVAVFHSKSDENYTILWEYGNFYDIYITFLDKTEQDYEKCITK